MKQRLVQFPKRPQKLTTGYYAPNGKRWQSKCKHYRITWRNAFDRIAMPPAFLVEHQDATLKELEGTGLLPHVTLLGRFKVLQRAIDACEKHARSLEPVVKSRKVKKPKSP